MIFSLRFLLDIEERVEKPDYYHDSSKTTTKVMLISGEFVENHILSSYQNVGNPAASKKTLVNVWIRIFRSLIRFVQS